MKYLLAAVAALWTAVAVAGPNWTYAELGYTIGDNDTGNLAPYEQFPDTSYNDGTKYWNINGMLEVGGLWHVGAFYQKGDYLQGNVEFDTPPFLSFGSELKGYGAIVGIHPALTDATDLVFQIQYTRADIRITCGDDFDDNFQDQIAIQAVPCVDNQKFDNDTYGLEAGVRSMINPDFEVNASALLDKNDIRNYEVAAKIGGQFLFTERFGLTATGKLGESQTEFNVGLRYNFFGTNADQVSFNGTR